MGELLAKRATESFVGRADEMATLFHCLDEGDPFVVHLYGIAGIGKSMLLEAFSAQARSRGAAVVRLDCRAVEPTERGFIHGLGTAIGGDISTVGEAAARLGRLGSRVVLALDTYEVFRLMDTWLRQVFVPALGDNVRLVLAGRQPPLPAWLTSPEWHGLCRSISLGPLSEGEALELLWRAGVRGEGAQRINRWARGHPLALKLAVAAAMERPALELEDVAVQRVVEELAHLYLADVEDRLTRKAVEAASVVRRITQSLLGAMLPEAAPQDAYDRLRTLPFVESGRDGLIVHDAVHEAVAAALRASDPSRYRDYRRAAWRQLRAEVRNAGMPELWRYTSDMLYIIENPVVREAFFPSGSQQFAVEPARPEDSPAIHTIAKMHEGPDAARLLNAWWARLPQSFQVVRDKDHRVAGFYCMFDPSAVNPALLQEDPVVRGWWHHLREQPVPRNQGVLFLRRWLSLEQGETPSPVQAACWLDIKRAYMALRPNLRRVYLTVCDLPAYAPAALKLGFRPLTRFGAQLDGAMYHTAMLDFGPSSVDGWLAGLVATELGIEEGGILDIDARELVIESRRVRLTPLEFGVMRYLYQHQGKAVTRASLLESVWGYDYEGGSNVVDAVVRCLRKKLGDRVSVIDTVRSVGYRFRGD
jgi:hypothetical protein